MLKICEAIVFGLLIVISAGCEPQFDHDRPDTDANKAGFRRHFNFSAPATVTNLYYWADGLGADIKYQLGFTAGQETIDRIVAELHLEKNDLDSSALFSHDFDWWSMDEIESLPVFSKKVDGKDYYKYLMYDSESRHAYYLEFSM